MNKIFLLICLLSIISQIANSQLLDIEIQTPFGDMSKTGFEKDVIVSKVANFGNVPYGQSVIGMVYLSDPIDGCSVIKSEKFQGARQPILIVKYGSCFPLTKVKYAQMSGAKLVVFIEDVTAEELKTHEPIGTGKSQTLQIPTLIINKDDGNKLINLIQSQNMDGDLLFHISFDFRQTAEVKYDFWILPDNYDSYTLIKDNVETYNKFKNAATFTPHYVTWYCHACKENQWQSSISQCLSGGRYCSATPKNPQLSGSDIVYEVLREICIYNLNKDLWWNYMVKFQEKCFQKVTFGGQSKGYIIDDFQKSQCVSDIFKLDEMSDLKYDDVEKCINESFETKTSTDKFKENLSDNKLLKLESETKKKLGLSFYPAVTIDGEVYRGNLSPHRLQSALCTAYIELPDACFSHGNIDSGSSFYIVILIIVFVLLVFMFLMIFRYKKMLKQEMSKEMNLQINSLVSEYFQVEGNSQQNIELQENQDLKNVQMYDELEENNQQDDEEEEKEEIDDDDTDGEDSQDDGQL